MTAHGASPEGRIEDADAALDPMPGAPPEMMSDADVWGDADRLGDEIAPGVDSERFDAPTEPGQRALTIVQQLVLPRLRLAHGLPSRISQDASFDQREWRSTSKAARAFAEYALSCDAMAVQRHLERFVQDGWTLEDIFFDLFEPSARRLGWLWEQDLCGFVDVALAVSRMSTAGRKLAAGPRARTRPARIGRRLLMVAAPDEAHRFGAELVAEMCRRHGWDVAAPIGLSADEICNAASSAPFDAVGVSLSDGARAPLLTDLIRQVRARARSASGAPSAVVVGGGAFIGNDELTLRVGADAMARDARSAPRQLSDVLEILACRA